MWFDILRIILGVLGGLFVVFVGIKILGFLAQKPPGPPPPGSLRKVQISYICSICFTEIQMKVAPVENPEPPKHCGEEMDLQAPIYD